MPRKLLIPCLLTCFPSMLLSWVGQPTPARSADSESFPPVRPLENASVLGTGVQRTMSLLGRDLIQASPRPVRDPLGDGFLPSLRTSLNTEFALEVTRGGWSNPAGLPRGTLQRAAYRLEEGELLRYHWNVLDPTIANEPIVTELLTDVDSLLFRYRTHNGDWSEQWPPQGAQGSAAWRIRPQIVEVVLTLPDEGEIRRLILGEKNR